MGVAAPPPTTRLPQPLWTVVRPWTQQKFRDEFLVLARKTCDSDIAAFAECARQNGMLMSPFRCGAQNKAMDACLRRHTTNDKYMEWKFKQCQLRGIDPCPEKPLR